jgi:hypothetical protein
MGNRLHRSQSSQASPAAESVCSAAGSEVAGNEARQKRLASTTRYHQCRAKHPRRDYLDRLLGGNGPYPCMDVTAGPGRG